MEGVKMGRYGDGFDPNGRWVWQGMEYMRARIRDVEEILRLGGFMG